MLGNFVYSNPTKIYFGEDAIEGLKTELDKYGENVLLVYGGGSIKKNGIYDEVIGVLKQAGKRVFEDGGVMPNPTVEKLYEGCNMAREAKADLILAVGAARCAIMQRLCRFPHTAVRIRGKNITSKWRMSTAG